MPFVFWYMLVYWLNIFLFLASIETYIDCKHVFFFFQFILFFFFSFFKLYRVEANEVVMKHAWISLSERNFSYELCIYLCIFTFETMCLIVNSTSYVYICVLGHINLIEYFDICIYLICIFKL